MNQAELNSPPNGTSGDEVQTPLVSCLMVTANRKHLMKRSVLCFNKQSYPNKELVVIDDGKQDLSEILSAVPPKELVYRKLSPSRDNTLGKLRNISLEMANGTFLAQWDDDDWYHPDRIKIQAEKLLEGYDACCLSGALMHLDIEPFTRHPYIGYLPDGIPGSIMHRKDPSITYPHTRRAEDTVYLNKWRKKRYIQLPGECSYLFLRCYHGNNTWEREHFLRRIKNSPLDFIKYVWFAKILGNVFRHPKFNLTQQEKESFYMFLKDSAAFELV